MNEAGLPCGLKPDGTTTKMQEFEGKLFCEAIELIHPCKSESLNWPLGTFTLKAMRFGETEIELTPYCAAYSEIGATACCAYCTIIFMSAVGTMRFPPEV